MRAHALTEQMSGSDASMEKFGEYFEKYIKFYTTFHHLAEDELMFPPLSDKFKLPQSLADAHDKLDHAIVDNVTAAVKAKDFTQLKVSAI